MFILSVLKLNVDQTVGPRSTGPSSSPTITYVYCGKFEWLHMFEANWLISIVYPKVTRHVLSKSKKIRNKYRTIDINALIRISYSRVENKRRVTVAAKSVYWKSVQTTKFTARRSKRCAVVYSENIVCGNHKFI